MAYFFVGVDTSKNVQKNKKINQRELAHQLGISQPSYSDIETGKKSPDVETILKIADILSVDATHLITGGTRHSINTAVLAQAIEAIEDMLRENKEPLSVNIKVELISLKYSEILANNRNM